METKLEREGFSVEPIMPDGPATVLYNRDGSPYRLPDGVRGDPNYIRSKLRLGFTLTPPSPEAIAAYRQKQEQKELGLGLHKAPARVQAEVPETSTEVVKRASARKSKKRR